MADTRDRERTAPAAPERTSPEPSGRKSVEAPERTATETYDRGRIEDVGRWTEFRAGMWAWLLHKFSGWVLLGYLFLHVPVLSTAIPSANGATEGGTAVYTATLQSLEALLFVRILEIGLLAVAVFHILNGVRLLFVDLGYGLENQDRSFYASLVVTGAIVVASVPTFLAGRV